ncbi:MAG TPA: GDP-L-fucose synthase [Candidatus Acidoferrales bacterium]|nr:GDP-L-fucose synthase [Candidatus Acidoferrales bacterium]
MRENEEERTESFWQDKQVLVTGGAGFLGSHVVEKLRARGCRKLFLFRSKEYDLREKEDIIRLLEKTHPEIVIHLAAVVGGIGANRKNSGRFFFENAIMGIQLIEQARRFAIPRFICLGTICSYPKFTPVPFREEDLWNGFPEETNAPYGLAKKTLLVQLQSYRQQYGFNGIYLLPVNLYGPRDNFDLETSHVIPAIIRKCVEAKLRGDKRIVAWGTANVSREFLYVEDAAEAIVLAAERYEKPEPVNLGSGKEITIRALVNLIRELSGFEGEVEWDASQPDGQPRRCLDTSRAEREFGFKAQVDLREGLRRTIEWYENMLQSRGVRETA